MLSDSLLYIPQTYQASWEKIQFCYTDKVRHFVDFFKYIYIYWYLLKTFLEQIQFNSRLSLLLYIVYFQT